VQPISAVAGGRVALLTIHGTILCAGAGPAQLRHVPITDADAAVVWEAAGVSSAALAGGIIQPSGSPPVCHVRRERLFLRAERDDAVAAYTYEVPGEWESLLPLSENDLLTLRRIVAADWFLLETGETIPRSLIRVGNGFALQFARWRINLQRDFPRFAATGHEADQTLLLRLDGEVRQFRQFTPKAAASSFRLERGSRFVLAAAPSRLPPPLTVSDADRAWVYRTADDEAALNGRPQPSEAVLRRESDVPWKGGGERLTGVSVGFWDAGPDRSTRDGRFGRLPSWVDAAIRLHVLAALAPPDASFLLPVNVPEDAIRAWHALGLKPRFRPVRVEPHTAEDLIWLDSPTSALPADALAALRDRLGVAPAPTRRILWREGVAPEVEAALVADGYQALDAATCPPATQIGVLAQASHVVARTGTIPFIFCQPGTRLIELTETTGFPTQSWITAVKLGLIYAVLPSAMMDGSLAPDPGKLTAMLRISAAFC
jgi:hypothetical protein